MYIGLMDAHWKEISARGYLRVYVGDMQFKISPPREGDNHLTFVNLSVLKFSPIYLRDTIEIRGIGFFVEPDSEFPIAIRAFDGGALRLVSGDCVGILPGQITFPFGIIEPLNPFANVSKVKLV